MTAATLALAEWLLEVGAGVSAACVLGDMRGARANRLRLRARDAVLRPGVYALVAMGERGIVLPLRPSPGRSRAADDEFRRVSDVAADLIRARLGRELPSLRFDAEEQLAVAGPSIGLPAALAFAARSCRLPATAVLATGRIDARGDVLAVGHMREKLAAAAGERGPRVVLVPPGAGDGVATETATVDAALGVVFGGERLVPDASLLRLEDLLARAARDPEPSRDIEVLEAFDDARLPAADRARLWLELGTLYRHVGRGQDAERLHDQARALLAAEHRLLGVEAVERYELELVLTRMDAFDLESCMRELAQRLERPFASARNEVRCRGMLAQALGMAGKLGEAVRVREENLALQRQSETLARLLPGTHCYVALDSARAGDAPTFEVHARAMCELTSPGDARQWRYNAASIVRGLVALGRPAHALAWASDVRQLFGHRPPPSLVRIARGDEVAREHPEVSIVRALCRAHRRTGRPDQALGLAARVLPPTGAERDLVGWLAALVGLEAVLALRDTGAVGGDAALAAIRTRLVELHAPASRFHAALLSGTLDEMEAEIDRVWY